MKIKKGVVFLLGFCWILWPELKAQESKPGTQMVVIDGDTVWYTVMDPILLSGGMDTEARQQYERLKVRVKKVLPYAKMAATKMKAMEDKLATITGKKERKKYIKECEASLKQLYTNQLKNMSIEDGKVLMKLLHRETGTTTWQIMKKYRGSAEALGWQAFSKVYGHNMKVEFDPVLDYQIENIIKVEKLE